MANISEDMASEDLKSLKFLLSSTLPREKIEKAKVGGQKSLLRVSCYQILNNFYVFVCAGEEFCCNIMRHKNIQLFVVNFK